MINEDFTVSFLVVQTTALLDVDSHQSGNSQNKHGDEPGQLAECNGEHDETHERHTNGCCRKCKESSTYAHKLQRFL